MSPLLAYSGPMGDGEVVAAIGSGLLAAVLWGRMFWQILRPAPMVAPAGARAVLILAPLVCIAGMGWLIDSFGDTEVRGDWRYVGMYTAMGALWLAVGAMVAFPLLGVYGRVDGLERRNRGAVIAHTGALVGLALCYAGGNFGDGPSWTVVIFSCGLATAALLWVWGMLEAIARVSVLISVHRDTAAALRLAGLLIGCGMIFGRGAAGTWVSGPATALDMLVAGWPAVAPLALEMVMSRMLWPTPSRLRAPALFAGVLPGLVYISFGAAVVYAMGWWA